MKKIYLRLLLICFAWNGGATQRMDIGYWTLSINSNGDKFILKYTIRSIVCEASCHPVTQSFGHFIIQSFGHLITQSLGHSLTWSLGHPVTWSFGHSVTLSQVIIPLFSTLRLTDEQHQGLQVCFADKYGPI